MFEALLVTEASGQHFNINVYNATNGQSVASFKGGTSQPNTLCLHNDEHVLSSVPNKPIIQVYEISRKNQQPKKIPLPGVVKSLCVSHDGALLAAGINNNVLIWELAGGELLSVLARHYQSVNCLAFSHDDSFLAASGEDGIVSVWDVGTVWDMEEEAEPYHSWTCHTMSVTCLKFGLRHRAYSSSLDCSIKVHDIPTRQTIMTIVFDFGVSCFDFSPSETSLFVGCTNGSLHSVNLLRCGHDSSLRQFAEDSKDESRMLVKTSHSKSVSCISNSLDGTFAVTGSEDGEVKFWDVVSLQCLKTMKFCGGITNLILIPKILRLTATMKNPVSSFPKLNRQAVNVDGTEQSNIKCFRITK